MITNEVSHSPDFFKDVSFHVSFHVKFGNMGCCDSIKHMFDYVTYNVKYYIFSQIFYKKIGDSDESGGFFSNDSSESESYVATSILLSFMLLY